MGRWFFVILRLGFSVLYGRDLVVLVVERVV